MQLAWVPTVGDTAGNPWVSLLANPTNRTGRAQARTYSPTDGHGTAGRTGGSGDFSHVGLFLPAEKFGSSLLNQVCCIIQRHQMMREQKFYFQALSSFTPKTKHCSLTIFNLIWQKSKDLMDTNFLSVQWKRAGERWETPELLQLK